MSLQAFAQLEKLIGHGELREEHRPDAGFQLSAYRGKTLPREPRVSFALDAFVVLSPKQHGRKSWGTFISGNCYADRLNLRQYTVTMFLVDVSPSMGKTREVEMSLPNGKTQTVEMTNLQWSLQFVKLKIQEMVSFTFWYALTRFLKRVTDLQWTKDRPVWRDFIRHRRRVLHPIHLLALPCVL